MSSHSPLPHAAAAGLMRRPLGQPRTAPRAHSKASRCCQLPDTAPRTVFAPHYWPGSASRSAAAEMERVLDGTLQRFAPLLSPPAQWERHYQVSLAPVWETKMIGAGRVMRILHPLDSCSLFVFVQVAVALAVMLGGGHVTLWRNAAVAFLRLGFAMSSILRQHALLVLQGERGCSAFHTADCARPAWQCMKWAAHRLLERGLYLLLLCHTLLPQMSPRMRAVRSGMQYRLPSVCCSETTRSCSQ